MRHFIIVLLILTQGCTSSSSSESSSDTYENTYSSDESLENKNIYSEPSKDILIEELNNKVAQLYLNNPIVEEFNWEGKYFTTEYSKELALRKMVCCYKVNEEVFEQVELFIDNKKVCYYRWDLFKGDDCNSMKELMNVEKGYIWKNKLLYSYKANDKTDFSVKSEVDKIDFILKIERELLQSL